MNVWVRVLTGKPVKKMSLEKGRGEENAATDYHSTIWKKINKLM